MEETGRDLLRYGRIVVSKEYFDSDGHPLELEFFTMVTNIGIPR